jgi:hypothetical protein
MIILNCQEKEWMCMKLTFFFTFFHSIAGVSRSVTMVIAFLMEKKGKSFEKALNLVQKKRKFA